MFQMLHNIIRTQGVRGLYAGIIPEYCKVRSLVIPDAMKANSTERYCCYPS